MRYLIAAFVAFSGLCFSSCKTKSGPKKLTIAVIPKGTTHEFWKTIHAGAVKAERELGVKIFWNGPRVEDDREGQVTVVEDFIGKGVSAIVLAPLDDVALAAPVATARQSGIPVIIIDSGLKSEDYASFVATDNYKGGYISGEHMAKILDGRGKVIMLRYQEGSASTMNRERGFLDAIGKHPGVEVVSSNQYGGATTESAFKASENLLATFKAGPGKLSVDGIFCPNESTVFAMLLALQGGKFAGNVHFVGFDSSPKLVEALAKGEVDSLTLQNPFNMGYIGVKTAVACLRGETVEKRVDTGVTLVTKQNMNEPEIKELLSPDLDKWLK